MSDIKLCRICLRKDVKMYEHDRFQLKSYYQEVTGTKITKKDCLPKWFCFECTALLVKFHEFKKKCLNGQSIFKQYMEQDTHLDTSHEKLTRLPSHLQLISSSRNCYVKTFIIKHKGLDVKKFKRKMLCKKKNYKIFTEVFVDDLKIDLDTQNNTTSKEPETLKTSVVLKSDSPHDDKDDLAIDEDFDNDVCNYDSNDSLPLKNNEDCREIVKEEIKKIADVSYVKENKNSNISKVKYNVITNCDEVHNLAEEPNYFNDGTNNMNLTDETSLLINGKINFEGRISQTTKNHIETGKLDDESTSNNNEIPSLNISHNIKYDMDTDKANLDNKFQRSVKKKFLDENHWTKITLSDEEAARRFQAKALEQKYLKADFKCTDCYRIFSQEDMMKRHIKLRHCESLGPHECRHCRMRFKWRSRLQKHLKEHYTIYKCLRCELSFPVEISAFQHDYSHNGVTWTCAHCGQRFRHSSTYYTHLRKHKSKYVCTLCGVSFVSEFGLFMHRRVKHVINEDCKEDNSNTYCKVCDIKFDTLKGYEDHFAESALHVTEVSDGTTPLPLKTRCTKRRVPRITTNCNICDRTFSTYAAFTKHHLSVHPGDPLPKSKTDKADGQRQICEVCGVTLASAWSLVNHLNTHTRDKRYTCKTCGMQLSSRSVLQRHQLTHSQDKNFVCDLCDKRFSHRSGLRLHLRTHDKDHSPTRSRKKKLDPPHVMDYFKNYGQLANFR